MLAPSKIRVLLIGNVIGAYRSQTLIKFLLDSECCISLISPKFYWTQSQTRSVKTRILELLFIAEFYLKAYLADVIYVLPLNNYFIKRAIQVAKFFNKKLVVEMYILSYDTFIEDKKKYLPNSPQAKCIAERDRLSLTQPDYIVTTAKYQLKHWEQQLNIKVNLDKVFIAPIFSDNVLESRRSFMQDGQLKICWWGNFIPLHGLDNILQAIQILTKKQVQFTCTLFGVDSPFFEVYENKIHSYQIEDHVVLRKDLKFSNYSLPLYLINNCDLALGIFGNTKKAYNAVPNKLIDALSMGIPSLTMRSPALEEFFELETDFWTCEPSPESIANAIYAIANNAAPQINWEQSRQKVLRIFSATQYQDIVSQILHTVTVD
ncbi:glycosyltransferase [Gloeocapsopsis dulcis]|uniref:Glycosyl transferase family 1 domain-containing protein n=1 Tax=Gloeocapsopsis dulcis AAB1 = 1H9 TaxID=1433147 RepID=A0A6N8G381_9CHRO|nr:glycosyltransferase [Gloeocapsopsis dulcis]MUL38965.1 hypothetical protein [Gloeocapsopsis dulcis AAB1 = 1H9]WNN89542.1 glycosyltransferase [Gloeocapsopsis dulcis]